MIDVVRTQYFCHDCGGWSLRAWKTLERVIEGTDAHALICQGPRPRRVVHGDY